MTKRLIGEVIIKLIDVSTYKSVTEEADISTTIVQRIFDNVDYPHISEMPEVLAIDEFKGNASGEKYQCILTDPKNRIVLDILPTRFENDLNSYFKNMRMNSVGMCASLCLICGNRISEWQTICSAAQQKL